MMIITPPSAQQFDEQYVNETGDTMTGRLTVPSVRVNESTIPYGANITVNFDGSTLQTCNLSGDVTVATSNRGVGKSVALRVVADGTERTVALASGIRPLRELAPFTVPANKIGILSLTSYGSNESDTVAIWVEEA